MQIIIEADSLIGDRLSGIGQYVSHVIRTMPGQTKDVKLLLPRGVRKIKGYDCDSISNPLPNRLFNIAILANKLVSMDSIYGQGVYWFPNYKHFRVGQRSRKIVAIHDLTVFKHSETMTPRNAQLLRRIIPRAIKEADCISVISHQVRKEIIDLYPSARNKKFLYMPPAVDPGTYKPIGNTQINRVKSDLDIEGEYMLFVSSIEPRKNLVNQLEGFARSQASKSHALVIIGGGGWKNEEIQSKVSQLRNKGLKIIKPDRYVQNDEVAALMSGATALLSASIYEGFGMPIIEAQACKCPVITSNISSMPEAAGKDGAVLVNPSEPNQIAEAIDQITTNKNLAKQLVSQGYKNQKRFSWDKSAATLLGAAKELSESIK